MSLPVGVYCFPLLFPLGWCCSPTSFFWVALLFPSPWVALLSPLVWCQLPSSFPVWVHRKLMLRMCLVCVRRFGEEVPPPKRRRGRGSTTQRSWGEERTTHKREAAPPKRRERERGPENSAVQKNDGKKWHHLTWKREKSTTT